MLVFRAIPCRGATRPPLRFPVNRKHFYRIDVGDIGRMMSMIVTMPRSTHGGFAMHRRRRLPTDMHIIPPSQRLGDTVEG